MHKLVGAEALEMFWESALITGEAGRYVDNDRNVRNAILSPTFSTIHPNSSKKFTSPGSPATAHLSC